MSTSVYFIEVNTICIAVLLILFFSLPKSIYIKKQNVYYRRMLELTLCICASDMVAGVLHGKMFAGARQLLWLSNIVFMLGGIAIGIVWVLYSCIVLKGSVSKQAKLAVTLLSVPVSVLIITTPLHGLIFTIDAQNIYHRGPMLWLQWLLIYPCEVLPSCFAFFTHADKKKKHAVSMFAVMPFICTVIQVLFYGVSVGQAGLTCSALMLYVLLQSEEVYEVQAHAAYLSAISNTDALTGLNNRRAYDLRLETITASEPINVFFLDLNGLKATNDTEGHKAGDKLIITFSEQLLRHFEPKEIYRISGDEFVVISTRIKESMTDIDALRKESSDMASCGSASGTGVDVLKLINEAEKGMYADKYAYYKRSGKERRNL